jgi:hypothetical protein
MPMCMRLMEVRKELSATKNPWSFQQGDFLNNRTGALEKNGITSKIAWDRKVFISLGCAG